jgi:hypothetical protein
MRPVCERGAIPFPYELVLPQIVRSMWSDTIFFNLFVTFLRRIQTVENDYGDHGWMVEFRPPWSPWPPDTVCSVLCT